MRNKIIHIITAVVLTILLVLISDTTNFWMPAPAQMVSLVFVAVLISLWSGFVMYEKTSDEREVFHKMYAGQSAYILGLSFLTVALLIQGFTHKIDPWISGAILIMVLSKLFARMYLEYFK